MKQTILVAGGTGKVGEKIVKALIKRGANVRAIVRSGSASEKKEKLSALGAEVVTADMTDTAALESACQGVSCVISALSGLRDVMVESQSQLLDAAVAAGVPRFIPSDYSSDFTQLPEGENRNVDLHKEFQQYLDKSPIAATSIMNGAFCDLILGPGAPLFDVKNNSVRYWGDKADWKIDFSTTDDTADYTAAAALDSETPRILRIASFQITPKELAAVGEEIKKQPFKLIDMGSMEDLSASNKKARAANPEGETEILPAWQAMQYVHTMLYVQNKTLDNDRYPDVEWTSAKEALSKV
ncbi:NmrA family NAD(P)-binding protein [Halotia branconii]|uniref:NmrA family NAD(P)-binding protein n=1 Tax=Halotia branconii CENA392 TaxID=1539056 RepID=A0AAJ6PAL7_9CYAN|nr:NmrA family NAD(P)-binding protein [Halotia branconii]WGV26851.1 NmrA family NAD(P)-binding protein [Halotia branconii CENA392]